MSKRAWIKDKYLWVAIRIIVTHLSSSFLDHFQLTLVDLDTPKEPIKEPEEDPTSQPEQTQGAKMLIKSVQHSFWLRKTSFRNNENYLK